MLWFFFSEPEIKIMLLGKAGISSSAVTLADDF